MTERIHIVHRDIGVILSEAPRQFTAGVFSCMIGMKEGRAMPRYLSAVIDEDSPIADFERTINMFGYHDGVLDGTLACGSELFAALASAPYVTTGAIDHADLDKQIFRWWGSFAISEDEDLPDWNVRLEALDTKKQ